jgi:AraC-like DNA-binding protein
MDVLSDAITTMRTGRPHSALRRVRAPWSDEFPASDGAGFHVVLQGTCWFQAPGADAVMLGTGDVVFLPRETGHRLSGTATAQVNPSAATDPGAEAVLLCGSYHLNGSRPHPLWNALPQYLHIPARIGSPTPLHAAIDLLGAELADTRPGSGAMIPALLDALLVGMVRYWIDTESDPHAGRWASAMRDPAIVAALTGIHQSPSKAWTVAGLAATAGLSRSSFSQRFTHMIGQPPMAYLTWWRMTIAAKLLRENDTSITAVAREVGYVSEFAFAKAFKREFGISPGKYRKPDPPKTSEPQQP